MASVIRGSGTSSLGGDLDIEGVLTYEDVSSVDSVGVITARSDLHVTSGRLLMGSSVPGNADADNINVAGADNVGMTFRGSTSGTGNIYFADGTSSDDLKRGQIVYDHSNNSMRFHTNATEKLRIKSDGKIGIGTDNPQSILHVSSPDNTGQIRVSSGGNPDGITITSRNDGTGSQINARGTDSHLRFYTTNASDTTSEKMRIDGDGRILAGTTSFTGEATLVLQASNAGASTQAQLWLNRGETDPATDNVLGQIIFGDATTSGSNGAMIQARADNSWGGANGNPSRIAFFTEAFGSDDGPDERLRIDSSGRVLLGTTSASGDALLQVNGPIQFGGGDIRMASHSRSYTASTSATDLFKVRFVTGHNAAEFTWMFIDSAYPNGARIGKIYMVSRGSGTNITNVSIVASTEASITNGTVTGITWSAAVHDVNHVRLTATGSATSGSGTMVLYGTSPNFDSLTPISDV